MTASPAATRTTQEPTSGKLAIDGGAKAFAGRTGRAQPKIGIAEFLSLASRFGFKPEVIARFEQTLSDDDLQPGGPNLARYFSASPKPPVSEAYEALAREVFGTKYALCTSSGTGALHAAMVAVGAGPGKEVIVPACGFIATAGAAALAGATPVFCDVDESLQIDPTKIEACITPRTVAVAPTHHWGVVCDMDPILAVARKHNIKVVEDCAQSPGASYHGRPVGSIGDIGCFSISAYKIIGGGEGGMVITSDQRLQERACQLAEFGGLWRPQRFAPPRYDGELFVGTNYRLSELEAAVDIVQLRKLADIVGRCRAASQRIIGQLRMFAQVRPQKRNDFKGDIGYTLSFFPQTDELGRKIATALAAEGISAGFRGKAAGADWHLYSDMFPLVQSTAAKCAKGHCPVADDIYSRCIRVGIDQWWSPEDCDAVAAGINKVLSHYCTPGSNGRGWC